MATGPTKVLARAKDKGGSDLQQVASWASAHQGDHLHGIEFAEVVEPTWMGKLPCLTVLVASSLLSVMGEFAVEIFAGSAVLTLGLMLSNVPVVKPWDAKFGERFTMS